MQILFGYCCATLVGISLGVLGSGGSILTVPIMVYIMGIAPEEAIIYSLFVVGFTSAIGGITYIKQKLVDWHIAIVFAIPSVISVFLTRAFILPLIPDPVFHTLIKGVSKDEMILILFSCLMIIAGVRMIFPFRTNEENISSMKEQNYTWLVFIGMCSGILTGLFGVGGGFIIIPALVLFANVPIHMSVGTSLLIIAFNSLTGFTEELLKKEAGLNYFFLLKFTAMSAFGIFLGYRISKILKANQLKKIFGWFILITGAALLLKETFWS